MKKIVLMVAMSLAVAGTAVAQKYGHCNFGSLVSAMPGTKEADSQLEAYQKQLISKGEEMAKAFQEKVAKYYQDQQSGDFTPKALADREQALQKEQQDLRNYEQEIQQKLAAKREELLKPLVDEVEAAISKVAKANGFNMIFDTSVFNAVLFAADSVDITDQVKAELGIE
jgi:outer membrane protein